MQFFSRLRIRIFRKLFEGAAHQSFTHLSADGNPSSLLRSVVHFGNYISQVLLRIRANGASGPKGASAILTLMNYVICYIGNQIKYTIALKDILKILWDGASIIRYLLILEGANLWEKFVQMAHQAQELKKRKKKQFSEMAHQLTGICLS